MPATKTRKRRRSPLTRGDVLARAMHLADTLGIESLSMRRLAGELRVEAMSLYHHVKNKDDILDGLVELVVGEIEVPRADGDWKSEMRKRATSAHQVLTRHPWGASLLMSRANVGPVMLTYVDATLGCLREAGFSYVMADYAWNTVDSFVYGFTLQQLNFPFEPDEYAAAAAHFIPQLPEGAYPYLVGLSKEVMEHRHDGLQDLSFGLELILDGLERMRLAAEQDSVSNEGEL